MSRRIFSINAFVVSLLLLVSAALGQKISYDHVDATDFGRYKTYTWKRAEKARYPDDQTDGILKNAIDKQMAAKGFTKVQENADVDLVYQLAIMDDAMYSSFNTDGQWHGGGANSIAIFTSGTTNTTTFIKVGWLILEIYDVSRKEQVWQVSARKTLGDSRDPKKMRKNADKVMAKVFDKFPSRSN
jgi:hypothetical protein